MDALAGKREERRAAPQHRGSLSVGSGEGRGREGAWGGRGGLGAAFKGLGGLNQPIQHLYLVFPVSPLRAGVCLLLSRGGRRFLEQQMLSPTPRPPLSLSLFPLRLSSRCQLLQMPNTRRLWLPLNSESLGSRRCLVLLRVHLSFRPPSLPPPPLSIHSTDS